MLFLRNNMLIPCHTKIYLFEIIVYRDSILIISHSASQTNIWEHFTVTGISNKLVKSNYHTEEKNKHLFEFFFILFISTNIFNKFPITYF